MADDRSNGLIGPRELLLHRFGSTALAALSDGATEADLLSVLGHAVGAWKRRQRRPADTSGRPARRLRVVPAGS